MHYNPSILETIKDIIGQHIDTSIYRPVLFGSRARGDKDTTHSDYDIGIIGPKKIIRSDILTRRDQIDDAIPYKVDLIDFACCRREFLDQVMKDILYIP